MKKLLLIAIILLSLFGKDSFAQFKELESGDHTLAININPIFPYFGNMFNQSTANDLNLTGLGAVYRSYKSGTKALRISASANIYKFSRFNQSDLDPATRSETNIYFQFAIGHEKHLNYGKWSIYYGWQAMVVLNNYIIKSTYQNESPDITNYTRRLLDNNGLLIQAGLGGFFGGEYYLSNNLFIGAELNLALLGGYRLNSVRTEETFTTDNNGNIVGNVETTKGENGFQFNLSTANPVIFRMGLRF
jgi:hypothetical protein